MISETIENIKKLESIKNSLQSIIKNFNEKISNKKNQIDKYGIGFNKDNRFPVFSIGDISFDCWIGSFGSSGCSTFEHIDSAIIRSYFLEVLNEDMDSILEKTAEKIGEASRKLNKQAREEIEEANNLLDRI